MQTIFSLLKLPKPTSDSITDIEIGKLIALRESKTRAKEHLAEIEDSLSLLEKDLIARIEAGAESQSHVLSIKTTERSYPSWKDAFVGRLGDLEAKKVTDSTQPTVSKSIIISSK